MTLPRTGVSPDLTQGDNAAYRRIDISAQAAGSVLRAMKLDEQAVAGTVFWASPLQTYRDVTPLDPAEAVTRQAHVYAAHAFGTTIELYMGSVAEVLYEQPPDITESLTLAIGEATAAAYKRRREQAADVSASAVEAMSHLADEVHMGPAALARERAKAAGALRRRTLLLRLAGSLATTAALAAAAYANHKTGALRELPVDGAAAIGSVLAFALGISGAKDAFRRRSRQATISKQWPADRRAEAWQQRYRAARAAGNIREIVTYEVSER